MKEIDLMIFDFDGTLVSTSVDLVNAVNFTLRQLKLPERTTEEIIGFVGDGLDVLMSRALGKHLDIQKKTMSIFTAYYAEHLMDNSTLYPHVLTVLQHFEHKKKLILTNKRHHFTVAIARRLNIEKYFLEIIGVDTLPFKKPDPRIIDHIETKYKIDREKMLMIGDGINDITVAKRSGILSCACLSGMGKKDDLLRLRADYYCTSLGELTEIFS